ncbi:MAG: hypothetical protein K6G22_07805 [Lachnospiraceae bacterium]|nr:hypothetical protein [Lachnospiraceae bacterium]
MAMKKSANVVKIIVVAVFCVLLIGLFAFLVNRRPSQADTTTRLTPVQELLSQNLYGNYPPTPKEVVKLYSEYTRCFYGEKYTDEELEALALKSRELLDEELVDGQTDADYLESLKTDIARYKSENRSISSYSVSSAADVEYNTFDGYDWAMLGCIYSMRIGKTIAPVNETYLLRKDASGHWKIYGWKLEEKKQEIKIE